MAITAAILAGGRATRMGGIAKGLIEIGGRTIIDRQLDVLRPMFDEILLVTNEAEPYERFGLPIVGDERRGCGPLGGLHAALRSISADGLFMCACDMPTLSAEVIRLVATSDPSADVAIPVVGGRPEPLHARYGKSCLPAIERALDAERYKMIGFFAGLRIAEIPEAELRKLDSDLGFLRNVNTLADLAP